MEHYVSINRTFEIFGLFRRVRIRRCNTHSRAWIPHFAAQRDSTRRSEGSGSCNSRWASNISSPASGWVTHFLDSVSAERRLLSQPRPHSGRAENIGSEARRIDGQAWILWGTWPMIRFGEWGRFNWRLISFIDMPLPIAREALPWTKTVNWTTKSQSSRPRSVRASQMYERIATHRD